MGTKITTLSSQEKIWISEMRLTRLSDDQECLIYPMGAERYLSSVLFGNKKKRYNIKNDIKGKDVLVIPGYGNNSFLFAQAGAKSVTVIDKDPITIAWLKAFKKYYHYKEYDNEKIAYPSIGAILTALTRWHPPLIQLPSGKIKNLMLWMSDPQALRRCYFFYMLSLIRNAINTNPQVNYELDKSVQFYVGEIDILANHEKKQRFDTAYVPYLLGVKNGIEKESTIVNFIKNITKVVPEGHILVSPSRATKEFYVFGKRYFITSGHSNIKDIPKLGSYIIEDDQGWYSTQGLTVFGLPKKPAPTSANLWSVR